MGTTPVCSISSVGIFRPSLQDCLNYFTASMQSIFGSDIVLDPSSQDGEWIGLLAAALDDVNAECVAAYNAFSPSTAQGAGLSSVVKINGLEREIPSYSTVSELVVGVFGTVISAGVIQDANGNNWSLPTGLEIPLAGQITVTATCQTLGAITAPAGTIKKIVNPTRGWQSVINTADATPGQPVELDPQLRVRQSTSAALPSVTILDGIVGAILAIPDVTAIRPYENDTNSSDANGLPGHTISLIVEGGDINAIASAIAIKKTPGSGTYGSTIVSVTDAYGIPRNICFFLPKYVQITWTIHLTALNGFTVDIQNAIAQAVSDWTNSLGIGNGILFTRAYGPALIFGQAGANTFEIQSITVARDGAVTAASDIVIAFNEDPICNPSYVNFVVTT